MKHFLIFLLLPLLFFSCGNNSKINPDLFVENDSNTFCNEKLEGAYSIKTLDCNFNNLIPTLDILNFNVAIQPLETSNNFILENFLGFDSLTCTLTSCSNFKCDTVKSNEELLQAVVEGNFINGNLNLFSTYSVVSAIDGSITYTETCNYKE